MLQIFVNETNERISDPIRIILIYVIQVIWTWKQSLKWADNIPGRNDPIFYNMPLRMGLATPIQRTAIARTICRDYPRLTCFLYLNEIHIHVNHPDLIKQVLTSPHCLKKSREYRFLNWNHGIGVVEPNAWHVTRKHLSPTVSGRALVNFLPIFDECSQAFVEVLKPKLDTKEEFDLLQFSVQCTLDSICVDLSTILATSFGVKVNALEKNIKFNEYLNRLHQITMIRMLNLHLQIDKIFRLTKLYQEDKFARSQCEKFSEELLVERKAKLKKEAAYNNNNKNPMKDSSKANHVNILVDQLLYVPKSDGTFYTKEEIRDNFVFFR
uniref:CSON003554 protein n=1 Tax=Culicoides sonorensis TaxID=179676 RepID=A0A336MLQ3_CULSO